MQPREELTIRRAIRDGGLTPRQELSALRALRDNPDDVSGVISSLEAPEIRRGTYEDIMARVGASRPEQSKDEQMFDTVSGIKDASLRAALSAAETPEDEELQLRNLYGLTETDYMRDSRGRLAITPSGGKKLGIELSQPTMIDESGFSRYDFADMAGIAPEVVGGVAGAIKGAALGLPCWCFVGWSYWRWYRCSCWSGC